MKKCLLTLLILSMNPLFCSLNSIKEKKVSKEKNYYKELIITVGGGLLLFPVYYLGKLYDSEKLGKPCDSKKGEQVKSEQVMGLVNKKPREEKALKQEKRLERGKLKRRGHEDSYREKREENWNTNWWEELNAIKENRIKLLEEQERMYMKQVHVYQEAADECGKGVGEGLKKRWENLEKDYQGFVQKCREGIELYRKQDFSKDWAHQRIYKLLEDLESRKYDPRGCQSLTSIELAEKLVEEAKKKLEEAKQHLASAKKRKEEDYKLYLKEQAKKSKKEHLNRATKRLEEAKQDLKDLLGEKEIGHMNKVRKLMREMKQWTIETQSPISEEINLKDLAQEIVKFEMGP